MQLIKLDAIDSTNSFLKKLVLSKNAKNFTTVSAKSQTDGRGQLNSKWISDPNKNLIMSMLISYVNQNEIQIFNFNIMVAVSVFEVLDDMKIPNLTIKWPNDMMSDHKKIGGILIENSVNSQKVDAIVGIGINVNQINFAFLPQASSLANVCGTTFDVDILVFKIAQRLKENFQKSQHQSALFWEKYHINLFRKDIVSVFENSCGTQFNGCVQGVTNNGKLIVKLEDNEVTYFDVKQIKFIY